MPASGCSSSGIVSLGTAPAITGTGPFTIELWLQTSSATGFIMSQRDAGGVNGEYILAVGIRQSSFSSSDQASSAGMSTVTTPKGSHFVPMHL